MSETNLLTQDLFPQINETVDLGETGRRFGNVVAKAATFDTVTATTFVGVSNAFSALTSSTNTTAAMVVGTGASLTVSGSGTINATTLNSATFAAPGTIGGTTPAAGLFTTVGVGTGTTAPATVLQTVETVTTSPRGIMSSQYDTGTNGARFHMRKARGTFAAPTVVVSGDNLGRLVASGYDGAAYQEMASIIFGTEGTIASGRVPTNIVFQTATNAAPSVLTTALTIDSAQNVSFKGTTVNVSGINIPNTWGISAAGATSGYLRFDATGSAGGAAFEFMQRSSPATNTSSGSQLILIDSTFSPGSGSGSWAQLHLNPTINGTSSGKAAAFAIASKTNTLTGGTIWLADIGTTTTDYFTGYTQKFAVDTSGNLTVAGQINFPGGQNLSGAAQAIIASADLGLGGAFHLIWTGRTRVTAPSDGHLRIIDNAQTGNGMLSLGATTLTLTAGAFGLPKMTASGTAPGATGSKFEVVCGTNAGTAKLVMYAGTSSTATTVLDNVGAGVTGC